MTSPSSNKKHQTRFRKLLACIAMIAMMSVSIAQVERNEAEALSSFDTELFSLINEHRANLGLTPFLQFTPLHDAALNWSNTMLALRNQVSDGTCSSILGSFDRFAIHDTDANIGSQGIPPGTTGTGENIGWTCGFPGNAFPITWSYSAMPAKCAGPLDYASPLMQFCQWVDSQPHRVNLEWPSFNYMGVGTVLKTSAGGQTEPLSTTRFATAPAITGCEGLTVTIDMNTNGGNGTGTAGNDVILGTPGADMIDAGAGDDTVCAEGGADVVVGGDGADTIFGGTGGDVIRGGPGADTIFGEGGADRLLGGIQGDTIFGGDGNDYIGGFGGGDTIDGGAGDDRIFGGYGADIIDGGLGADNINGLIGNDRIDGGGGADTVNGDAGNDTVRGGSGDDVVNGGNAADQVFGDGGNDTIAGGKADDTLDGGDGFDVCSGNKHFAGDTAVRCENTFGVE